ncbi:hypothetical protein F5148DRAFT_131422 [Russula earlei]|uniref:Uncharacterized protein n=1 Tax=Russula earlei TaxID=71964 RepID=A0ACC0U7C8_9AGAM|nr:hypothetical protein F5148DRAFT_131422 [Russula earlei]
MSLERRKPFALLYPNAKPTDSAPATSHLTISRPRRQMPAYHYQLQQNPHKRYATMLPGSSRSSATSSAESLYSASSSMPRRRKLSAAEDVAARVRARWAALEALERASGALTTNTIAATATGGRIGTGMDSHVPEGARHSTEPQARVPEQEKENTAASASMQTDGYEKPLPPRPAALVLRINSDRGPAHAAHARSTAAAATAAMVPMVVDDIDAREDDRNDASPGGEESPPAGDSTLRTTPTSLTCFETESLRSALQRRPTRALTPPQVRRRPSMTDELEEAREEATVAMLQSPRTDGMLRCPRRGCDELLGGVRALTFHLHIHAVGAGAYACVRCGGAFESPRELTRHACARRRARERLRSVVRAWTCLSPTSQSFGKQQQQQILQRQQPRKHYRRKDDNEYY